MLRCANMRPEAHNVYASNNMRQLRSVNRHLKVPCQWRNCEIVQPFATAWGPESILAAALIRGGTEHTNQCNQKVVIFRQLFVRAEGIFRLLVDALGWARSPPNAARDDFCQC